MRVSHLTHNNGIALVRLSIMVSMALALLLAASTTHAATVSVSATVLSKSICRFTAKAVALDFGTLDAGNPIAINRSVNIGFVCQGSVSPATYAISDDDGLAETGIDANRMQHTVDPTQFIPYTLALSTTSGSVPKMVTQTLTLTGDLTGADYQFAAPGTYADTVTLSIIP